MRTKRRKTSHEEIKPDPLVHPSQLEKKAKFRSGAKPSPFLFMKLSNSLKGKIFRFFTPLELARMLPVSKGFLDSGNEVGSDAKNPAHLMISFDRDRGVILDQLVDSYRLSPTHLRLLRTGEQRTIMDQKLFELIRHKIFAGQRSLRECIEGINGLLSDQKDSPRAAFSEFVIRHLHPWQQRALEHNQTFEEILTGQAIVEYLEPDLLETLLKEAKNPTLVTPQQWKKLKGYQRLGLILGFSLKQVVEEISMIHIEATSYGFTPDQLDRLSPEQVLKLYLNIPLSDPMSSQKWRDLLSDTNSVKSCMFDRVGRGELGLLSQMLLLGGYFEDLSRFRSLFEDKFEMTSQESDRFFPTTFLRHAVYFQQSRVIRYVQHMGGYGASEWLDALTKRNFKFGEEDVDSHDRDLMLHFGRNLLFTIVENDADMLSEMLFGIRNKQRRFHFKYPSGESIHLGFAQQMSIFQHAFITNNVAELKVILQSYSTQQLIKAVTTSSEINPENEFKLDIVPVIVAILRGSHDILRLLVDRGVPKKVWLSSLFRKPKGGTGYYVESSLNTLGYGGENFIALHILIVDVLTVDFRGALSTLNFLFKELLPKSIRLFHKVLLGYDPPNKEWISRCSLQDIQKNITDFCPLLKLLMELDSENLSEFIQQFLPKMTGRDYQRVFLSKLPSNPLQGHNLLSLLLSSAKLSDLKWVLQRIQKLCGIKEDSEWERLIQQQIKASTFSEFKPAASPTAPLLSWIPPSGRSPENRSSQSPWAVHF